MTARKIEAPKVARLDYIELNPDERAEKFVAEVIGNLDGCHAIIAQIIYDRNELSKFTGKKRDWLMATRNDLKFHIFTGISEYLNGRVGYRSFNIREENEFGIQVMESIYGELMKLLKKSIEMNHLREIPQDNDRVSTKLDDTTMWTSVMSQLLRLTTKNLSSCVMAGRDYEPMYSTPDYDVISLYAQRQYQKGILASEIIQKVMDEAKNIPNIYRMVVDSERPDRVLVYIKKQKIDDFPWMKQDSFLSRDQAEEAISATMLIIFGEGLHFYLHKTYYDKNTRNYTIAVGYGGKINMMRTLLRAKPELLKIPGVIEVKSEQSINGIQVVTKIV